QLAHPFALVFFVVLIVTWELLLRRAFGDEALFKRFGKPRVVGAFLFTIGGAVIAADCAFYYSAMIGAGWSGATLSFAALFSTAGFVCVNAVVVLISLFLSPKKPQKEDK